MTCSPRILQMQTHARPVVAYNTINHVHDFGVKYERKEDVDHLIAAIKDKYKKQPINTIDGVKIEFDNEWVHLRRSNTEPIIRIYAESQSETTADNLAEKIIQDIRIFIK